MASVFVYDAENRLITLEPKYVSAGVKRTRFEYDALGRRIRKWREECTATSPLTWSPITVPTSGEPEPDLRYVRDGWLLLQEVDGLDHNSDTQPDNIVLRQYTWGMDLSQSRPGVGGASGSGGTGVSPVGAGGIGGLLALRCTQGTSTCRDQLGLLGSFRELNMQQHVSPQTVPIVSCERATRRLSQDCRFTRFTL